MAQVAAEADELPQPAKKDGWPDIARQGDAVRQQINAAKNALGRRTSRRALHRDGAPGRGRAQKAPRVTGRACRFSN